MRRLFIQVYVSIALLALGLFGVGLVTLSMLETNESYYNYLINTEYERLKPLLVNKNRQQAAHLLQNNLLLTDQLNISIRAPDELPQVLQEVRKQQTTPKPFYHESSDTWYAYYPIENKPWGVYINDDTTDALALFVVVVLPVLLVLFSLAAALIWVIRRFARPLLELERSAQRLGDGDIQSRVEVNETSPVFPLANNFNRMAEKLGQSFQQQQTLIGAIPHELRTPLHRIRFALDMTRQSSDIQELHQRIEKIDDYVTELEAATQDILELSRLQSGDALQCTSFEMDELLRSVQQAFQDNTKATIVVDCPAALRVFANRELLSRALANLTANACHHASKQIRLEVQEVEQGIQIAVVDDGPGIPKQYQQQIFTPFFRVDDSRNRNTGGIGLGLALVQMIIRKHQGTIRVQEDYVEGTRIVIFL
ncbi:MAG: HAMP domain-containing sensor histidine kinase, partial [Thiolinea sp.]